MMAIDRRTKKEKKEQFITLTSLWCNGLGKLKVLQLTDENLKADWGSSARVWG